MPDILVCNPEYFEVSYSINPFMVPTDWEINKEKYYIRAKSEWKRFVTELQKITDVDLHNIPPSPGIPDLVFTANAGSVLNKKALLSRFKHSQRQAEEPYFLTMFEELKKKKIIDTIETMPDDIFFEGCGDCLWDAHRQVLWFGYGQRSDLDAANIIKDYFNVKVLPLQLTSNVFYHLDTCFCPLTNGEVLYYPNAFSSEALRLINEYVDMGKEAIIPHEWSDITKLAMNAICIGNDVVISYASADLECRLYDKGYNVIKTPLDSFLKSGGGPACLHLSLSMKTN